MKEKHSLKFRIGIAFIAYATFMLVATPVWMFISLGNVDFPCEWFGDPTALAKVNSDTRIAYCISVFPRSKGGGAPLVYGSTTEDGIRIDVYGSLDLQRQEDVLLVNNHILKNGETSNRHLVSLTLNPWLLATTDLSVQNEGVLKTEANHSGDPAYDILQVSGDAYEGWRFTPLGFIFWGIGVSLLVLDKTQRMKKSRTKLNPI